MLKSEIELDFDKIQKFDKSSNGLLRKISHITKILIKSAKEKKITHIATAISPFIFPSTFSHTLQKRIFDEKIISHISLAGIDSGILDNAKEIGMEKYLERIDKLSKMKFTKLKPKSIQKKSVKKTIKVKLGPNNIHTILDSLEIEH